MLREISYTQWSRRIQCNARITPPIIFPSVMVHLGIVYGSEDDTLLYTTLMNGILDYIYINATRSGDHDNNIYAIWMAIGF